MDQACPEALQEIIETFHDAAPEERLDMLLEYALNMPDLPEELLSARDTMEQVHECQTPVFLHADLHDGKYSRSEAIGVDLSIRALAEATADDHDLLTHGMALFDGLYSVLKQKA